MKALIKSLSHEDRMIRSVKVPRMLLYDFRVHISIRWWNWGGTKSVGAEEIEEKASPQRRINTVVQVKKHRIN